MIVNRSNKLGLVVPDETRFEASNFTQLVPRLGRDVVSGFNLVFTKCNLCNVKPEGHWVLIDCNNTFFQDVEVAGPNDEDGNPTTYIERQIIDCPL